MEEAIVLNKGKIYPSLEICESEYERGHGSQKDGRDGGPGR